MVNPSIGRRLQECRVKAGLGQEEIAKRIGIGVTAVSNIERGSNYPTVENLITFMNIVGASADYIFQDVLDSTYQFQALGFEDIENLPEKRKQQIKRILEILMEPEE